MPKLIDRYPPEENCIGEIVYGFCKWIPIPKGRGVPPTPNKGESYHHQPKSFGWELGACLNRYQCVEVATLECIFHIELCCEDYLVWVEYPGCYCPVDESLHRSPEIAGHQLIGVDSAVHQSTRLPLPALVVCW